MVTLAVSYFFFIGLAFSSVFVGLLIHKMEKNVRHEFIAIIVALSCAIVAPIALTADLHQPSRIVKFLFYTYPLVLDGMGCDFLTFILRFAVVGYFYAYCVKLFHNSIYLGSCIFSIGDS
ncbi:TtrC [Pasteurella multocida subsp. gallicida str. Anand1_poultry]|nr:TtrC [Pasteurella multocida subsp. gallicida str. Anand1_poultry]